MGKVPLTIDYDIDSIEVNDVHLAGIKSGRRWPSKVRLRSRRRGLGPCDIYFWLNNGGREFAGRPTPPNFSTNR